MTLRSACLPIIGLGAIAFLCYRHLTACFRQGATKAYYPFDLMGKEKPPRLSEAEAVIIFPVAVLPAPDERQ